jgi:hypothetical protein
MTYIGLAHLCIYFQISSLQIQSILHLHFTMATQTELHRMDSLDKVKADIQHIEGSLETPYLDRFPLLVNKNPEELAKLNKSLLKKLDWRFLPTVTIMLLMAYEISRRLAIPVANIYTVTSTASTFQTPVSRACKGTYTCRIPCGPLASPSFTSVISARSFQQVYT